MAAFAVSAFVVPTLTPIATTDDWGYARSVEILYHEGRLEIFPVVAATAVFQVVWGWLFALLFGPSLGVFRLSTVVMVALGGWALYGTCRLLGITAGRAALATAAYLFNPLAFVLAFTFMTDPHFTALLLISAFFYLRGLPHPPTPSPAAAGEGENGAGDGWSVVIGSGVAGLAFLTRQQGALIPIAVVTYLLLAGRLRPDRASLDLLLRVTALPALAAVGYLLWLRFFNEVPVVQTKFLRDAIDAGWDGTWRLVRRLTVVELVYLGFFALPVVAAALPALRHLMASTPRAGLLTLFAWQAIVVGGVAAAWATGGRMPYVGQFFGAGGLGAPDVLGSRPHLLDATVRGWLTVACAVASVLLGLLLCRGFGLADAGERARAGLVLALALWQVVGVLPPSYQYIRRGGSLDRYLLPLLPLALCLALWALRDVRLALPAGWLVVAGFALFAVAGTRDYLVFMRDVWDLARWANAAGVANERLDAGSGWDGYHLYEASRDDKVKARTRDGPWWVYFYAPATDSTYVVATKPLRGYIPIVQRDVSSWLETEPTRLYLLRRFLAPWPPRPPAARAPDPGLPANRSGAASAAGSGAVWCGAASDPSAQPGPARGPMPPAAPAPSLPPPRSIGGGR